MKRLHKRERVDNLASDVRKPKGSVAKWVYLFLVSLLLIWLADIFLGKYLFFRAEGMVTRDQYTVAVPYPANVKQIHIQEGQFAETDQTIIELESLEIFQELATLDTQIAEIVSKQVALKARYSELSALMPAATKRAEDMRKLLKNEEEAVGKGLQSNQRLTTLLEDEYDSVQALESIRRESTTIESELNQLNPVIERLKNNYRNLENAYANGMVRVPSAGTVAEIMVTPGSVISRGDPLATLLTSDPYVLAYVTPGSLMTVKPGDEVSLRYGLETLTGKIDRVFPISAPLPKEFQRTFRPQERSQVLRISIDPESGVIPATFSKVNIVAAGILPSWFMSD